ncbi:hypothetical protein Avbf_09961, partial [Armadillidium vulgare]
MFDLSFLINSDSAFERKSTKEAIKISIDIIPLQTQNIISIYISECYILPHIGVQECLDHDYSLQARFSYPKDCLFLGMGFANNGKIFIGISLSCLSVPSAKFCYNGYITLRERVCVYKLPKDELFVKFRFKQGLGRDIDGIPLILPCNPGGYVVDTASGRFATLELCESLFSPPKAKSFQAMKHTYEPNIRRTNKLFLGM